jgi:hypothetical protein
MPSWVMFKTTNTEGHFIEHFINVTTPVKVVRSCFCHSESKISVVVAKLKTDSSEKNTSNMVDSCH